MDGFKAILAQIWAHTTAMQEKQEEQLELNKEHFDTEFEHLSEKAMRALWNGEKEAMSPSQKRRKYAEESKRTKLAEQNPTQNTTLSLVKDRLLKEDRKFCSEISLRFGLSFHHCQCFYTMFCESDRAFVGRVSWEQFLLPTGLRKTSALSLVMGNRSTFRCSHLMISLIRFITMHPRTVLQIILEEVRNRRARMIEEKQKRLLQMRSAKDDSYDIPSSLEMITKAIHGEVLQPDMLLLIKCMKATARREYEKEEEGRKRISRESRVGVGEVAAAGGG